MYELIYTSTPQGLITGRSGFTTVALTEGFPPNLITPIENLSGYKPVFISGEEHENRNPVNFSCQQFRLGRTSYIVLSKISYAGLSYTGRSNVLAQHLLFLQEELDQIPGGAVSVLRAEENFPPWSGEPRMLAPRKHIASRPLPAGGEVSLKLTGDARWGRCIAESFRTNPDKGFSLAFDPLQNDAAEILDLIAEVAACLTGEEIRKLTFSTYSYLSGAGNPLFIRSYVSDSAQLSSIRRLEPGYVIDLGSNNPLPQSWLDMLDNVKPVRGEKTISEEISVPLTVTDTAPAPVSGGTIPETAVPSVPASAPVCHLPEVDFNSRGEDDTNNRSAEEGRKNKWIFFPVIFALIFICLVAFLSILFPKTEKGKGVQSKPAAAVAESGFTEINVSEPEVTHTAVSSSKNGVSPVTQPEGSVYTVPAVSKNEPEQSMSKTADIFNKPARRDIYNLYLSIFRGNDYKLPASLRSAVSLEIVLNSVGGMSELPELQNFIKGNNSKTVVVCSRKFITSGLMTEWKPDSDPDKQMTLHLSQDGCLRIRLPRQQTSGTPAAADIAQISFISENGKKITFDLLKLPDFVDRMLTSSLKVSHEFEDAGIKFMLYIPDDLWTFRSFYNIDINGRNLGSINSRKIVLHELDLHILLQTLEKRNMMLQKFREAEKLCREFKNKHAADLKKTGLKVPSVLGSRMAVELENSAINDSDEKWELQKNAAGEKLQKEVANKKISEKEVKDFLKELDGFRKRTLTYKTLTKTYLHLRSCVEEYQLDYAQIHDALKNDLKNISPALYRANRKQLEGAGDPVELKSDFYRKINPDKLIEGIKIKIIQKVR